MVAGPWRALRRLQSLELRFAPDDVERQPGSSAAAAGLEGSHAAGNWADAVYSLIEQLPALAHLRLQDLPNPADDPSTLRLLVSAAAAASASHSAAASAAADYWSTTAQTASPVPEWSRTGPPATAVGFSGTLQSMELGFMDATDECDYVRDARVTFTGEERGGHRHAGERCSGIREEGSWEEGSCEACGRSVSGDRGGGTRWRRRRHDGVHDGGGAACGSGSSGQSRAGGVSLGLHVMAVANDNVDSDSNHCRRSSSSSSSSNSSRSTTSGRSGSSSSEGGGGSGGSHGMTDRGTRGGASSGSGRRNGLTVRGAGSDRGSSEPGTEGGSEEGCHGDSDSGGSNSGHEGINGGAVTGANCSGGSRYHSQTAARQHLSGAGCPAQPLTNDVTDDIATAIDDLLRALRLQLLAAPRSGGRSPAATDAATATGLSQLAIDPGVSSSCGAAAYGTTPGLSQRPWGCSRMAAPVATVSGLEIVLCCDATVGARGGQALSLDLGWLPSLASLGLQLFSDTAAISFSQGCELQLRGLASLTSLRLMRSDGSAPPPELGRGLVSALAREAPNLRCLVAEGAVLKAGGPGELRTRQVARGTLAGAAAPQQCQEVDGGGCAGLAALPHCKRLQHLALRLMPYCGPPRYSRTVCTAWLPPSLKRLELENVELTAAAVADPRLPLAPRLLEASTALQWRPESGCSLPDELGGATSAASQAHRHPGQYHPALLPRLSYLRLQSCHVPDMLSLLTARRISPELAHVSVTNCTAPGVTAAVMAAAWPHLRHLAVGASLLGSVTLNNHPQHPQQQQLHRQQQQMPGQGTSPAGRGAHIAREGAPPPAPPSPSADQAWALRQVDIEALARMRLGLRSLFWHSPRDGAGVDEAALSRLSLLTGLRQMSLHLGYDNHITPKQLVEDLGRIRNLVELEVVVGFGPCRAFVGGETTGGPSGLGVAHGSLGEMLAAALPGTIVAIRRS